MSLTIDLSPEIEHELRAEAARQGRAPEDFAGELLEERLAVARHERHGGLAALMDQWIEEGPDLAEAEGYPVSIEPLRLREVRID